MGLDEPDSLQFVDNSLQPIALLHFPRGNPAETRGWAPWVGSKLSETIIHSLATCSPNMGWMFALQFLSCQRIMTAPKCFSLTETPAVWLQGRCLHENVEQNWKGRSCESLCPFNARGEVTLVLQTLNVVISFSKSCHVFTSQWWMDFL